MTGETIKGYQVAHEAVRILRQTLADFELVVTFDPPGPIDEFTRSGGAGDLTVGGEGEVGRPAPALGRLGGEGEVGRPAPALGRRKGRGRETCAERSDGGGRGRETCAQRSVGSPSPSARSALAELCRNVRQPGLCPSR